MWRRVDPVWTDVSEEGRILHGHSRENLRFYKKFIIHTIKLLSA
jgi:hypothetical protein